MEIMPSNNTFVGQMDCKTHRSEQRFEVLSLHLEDKHLDKAQFMPSLMNELQRFADFNQCTGVVNPVTPISAGK